MGKVQSIETKALNAHRGRGETSSPAWDSVEFREAMYDDALKAGLPIVSEEVCAIICAMLLVHGNHEMFTHNHRLVCELKYAQKRFHLQGSETPDVHFATLLRGYVNGLELFYQREGGVPDYINSIFKERYGFEFHLDYGKKQEKQP